MMEYILPTIGCTLVGAVGYYFYAKSNTIDAKRNEKKGIYGTKLTEGLISFRAVLSKLIEKVEVLNQNKIKFYFYEDAPRRDRIETAGGLPIFSKKWFHDNQASLDESRLEPALGSGPYVLESYDINQEIRYKRNKNYWGRDLNFSKG